MNELALFAGAGGGILGGSLLGWRTVCAVELNEYCAQCLMARQNDGLLPAFPIWNDVRSFDAVPWRGFIDVVSGGFPCQDISTAGGPNRQGIDGKRSSLWAEMHRIIGDLRPRFALVENSPALTFRGLGRVLGDLAEIRFDARWGVFSAADVGARHERERIWILACNRDTDTLAAISKYGILQPSQESIRAMSRGISAQPEMGRKVDGLAHWLDRLEAIGNGQVPQVAAYAWAMLGGPVNAATSAVESV